MRTKTYFACILMGIIFLVLPSCADEEEKKKEKNDYSGVGKIIHSRNKARYFAAENPPKKKRSPGKTSVSKSRTADRTDALKSEPLSKQERLSSIVLYEEKIKILGSKSGKKMADGVAYINKKGEIVKIKILKN